jgi:hypothetical protein
MGSMSNFVPPFYFSIGVEKSKMVLVKPFGRKSIKLKEWIPICIYVGNYLLVV